MKKLKEYDVLTDIPNYFNGECILSNQWKCQIVNGVPHKEDGPAIISIESSELANTNISIREWWIQNTRHRLDGPAVEFIRTEKNCFFINNNRVEPKDFWFHPLVIKNKLDKILSND